MIRFIKDWTLVIAMLAGSLFYPFFNQLSVTTPYLIFLMLLLTFTKLSPRKIRLHPLHAWLAA
ncbi:MAG: transporter, partial [Bacteroidales bacterium]|nr:transporter [Bacteroidales bacterium]